MKKLLIALILATMAATVCVVGVELANAESSAQFFKFFGFASLLIIDVYAIVAILRNGKHD